MSLQKTRPKIADPAKAWTGPKKRIPLRESIGYMAATSVAVYPPGVPEIYQGEIISEENITTLLDALKAGQTIDGLGSDGTVLVVADVDPADQYQYETWRTPGAPLSIINEFSDAFAPAYAGEVYQQFAFKKAQAVKAFKEGTPVKAIPPWKVPGSGLSEKKHYSLAELNKAHLPDGYMRWVSPKKCRKITAMRCRDEGFFVLVRDQVNGEIVGFLHTRTTTAEEHARTEENGNQVLFSELEAEKGSDLYKPIESAVSTYLEKLMHHTGIEPHQKIVTISAQWLHPRVRGSDGVYYKMMHLAAKSVEDMSWMYLPYIAETPSEDGGKPYLLNSAVADEILFGLLTNGDAMAYSPCAKNTLIHFITENKEFLHYAVEKRMRELATRYRPLPTDNPKVEIRPAGRKGFGVFAKAPIAKGERIAVFTGPTYIAERATLLPPEARDTAIQVGEDEFVHGHLGLAEKLNHECGLANCYIDGKIIIRAARDIAEGEELCWNYSTSECSDWKYEKCDCGSPVCLGSILSFQDLPRDQQLQFLIGELTSQFVSRKFAYLLSS